MLGFRASLGQTGSVVGVLSFRVIAGCQGIKEWRISSKWSVFRISLTGTVTGIHASISDFFH